MLFNHTDVIKFLDETEGEAPPAGNDKQKGLNVIMASSMLVGAFDEARRRVPDHVEDAFNELREAISSFDPEKGFDVPRVAGRASDALRSLAKLSKKLVPVHAVSMKMVVLALIDAGFVKAKIDDDMKKAILSTRSVLVGCADRLAESAAKLEKAEEN